MRSCSVSECGSCFLAVDNVDADEFLIVHLSG
jgi:hypothetical protein